MFSSAAHTHKCRYEFPHPERVDPEGIGFIATGGDLAPDTLIAAYTQGLFPWFDEDDPIAWWSPDPRCVLIPQNYKPSKSLKKQAKSSLWRWSVNQAFEDVIHRCSLPRSYSQATWIHDDMMTAYTELHRLGFAHSIEIWDKDTLIGGLYGLKFGQMYCGESMFHKRSNASKLAFWALNQLCVETHIKMIDCQLVNSHLLSLGAVSLSRRKFLEQSSRYIKSDSLDWNLDKYANKSISSLLQFKR